MRSKKSLKQTIGPQDDFNAWDPKILAQIDELIKEARPSEMGEDNRDLIRQLIVTALKTEHAQLSRGDVKILTRALRELRYGFRIFKDYRDRRKVTIFGSARTPKKSKEYRQALSFAQKMAKAKFMAITGAGPGIMQAGNEGAGKNNSFGINIKLPFEQSANEFISRNPRFIDCRFFFTRKLMFLKETSAVAFFPGGFGTHDEAMETLTLVQTGKADIMPLVFIDHPGGTYWKDWQKFIDKQLLKTGKISPEDLSLYKITNDVDEAVEEILHFYSNYHSMRFVRDELVIRLQRPLPVNALRKISTDFKDICTRGSIMPSDPLPEEQEYLSLPRLALQFNRLNCGRLRKLINRINEY
jgi:uncharacterized protein (TIGR00730 family)